MAPLKIEEGSRLGGVPRSLCSFSKGTIQNTGLTIFELGFVVLALLVSACSVHSAGQIHVVKAGETLEAISEHYDVSAEHILVANRIEGTEELQAGMRLVIPPEQGLPPWSKNFFEDRERPFTIPWEDLVRRDNIPPFAGAPSRMGFIWPLQHCVVTSPFGRRREGHFHSGIDLGAVKDSPVYASGSGRVIFSGYKRGYGRVVMIRHIEGITTVYGHQARNLVRRGEWVRRGEVIGLVGRSGNATGYHLHMEVWRGTDVINPLEVFPRDDRRLAVTSRE